MRLRVKQVLKVTTGILILSNILLIVSLTMGNWFLNRLNQNYDLLKYFMVERYIPGSQTTIQGINIIYEFPYLQISINNVSIDNQDDLNMMKIKDLLLRFNTISQHMQTQAASAQINPVHLFNSFEQSTSSSQPTSLIENLSTWFTLEMAIGEVIIQDNFSHSAHPRLAHLIGFLPSKFQAHLSDEYNQSTIHLQNPEENFNFFVNGYDLRNITGMHALRKILLLHIESDRLHKLVSLLPNEQSLWSLQGQLGGSLSIEQNSGIFNKRIRFSSKLQSQELDFAYARNTLHSQQFELIATGEINERGPLGLENILIQMQSEDGELNLHNGDSWNTTSLSMLLPISSLRLQGQPIDIISNPLQAKILTEDLSANAQISLKLSPDQSWLADIQANILDLRAERLWQMFATDSEPRKWLKQALYHGQINQGKLRLGLSSDPNSPMEINLQMNLTDGKLKFHPDWPVVENGNGTIIFNNGNLQFYGALDYVGVHFPEIYFSIPNYIEAKNPTLAIAGAAKPIEWSAADEVLDKLPINPDINMPQAFLVKSDEPVILRMSIYLGQTKVDDFGLLIGDSNITFFELPIPPISLATLVVNRTNNIWHGNTNWQSLAIASTADFQISDFGTEVNFTTAITDTWLLEQFQFAANFGSIITGEMEIAGTYQQFGEEHVVLANSNLYGMNVNLPSPLGKSSNNSLTSTISLRINPQQTIIKIQNSDYKLNSQIKENGEDFRLAINQSIEQNSPYNLQISLDQVNWSKWQANISSSQITSQSLQVLSASPKQLPTEPAFTYKININNLTWHDINLNDVKLTGNNFPMLSQDAQDWHLFMQSEQNQANATWQKDQGQLMISLQALSVSLPTNQNLPKEKHWSDFFNETTAIEQLQINISDLHYNKKNYGSVWIDSSRITPQAPDLILQNAKIVLGENTFSLYPAPVTPPSETDQDTQSNTVLDPSKKNVVEINVPDITGLLVNLDADIDNFDGSVYITGKTEPILYPSNFSSKLIEGDFTIVGHSFTFPVNENLGLLAVLSPLQFFLQTPPEELQDAPAKDNDSLDPNPPYLTANSSIKNSIITSDNIIIQDNSILVSLTGSLNLETEEVNFKGTLLPGKALFSIANVILGVATSGVNFLVGEIINSTDVFESQISEIGATDYQISGTFDDIQVQPLDSSPK